MLNYSRPALNKSIWGIHINSARILNLPPPYPNWLNPYQQKEWQDRGFVVWDATNKIVTHVYASYALKILETLKRNDIWKTSSFIVGSPAYQIPIPNTRRKKKIEETSVESAKEGWILTNKIELSSERAAELLEFLTVEEDTLKQIAIDEHKEVRETLGKAYSLLAEYGIKIKQAKDNGSCSVCITPEELDKMSEKDRNYFYANHILEEAHDQMNKEWAVIYMRRRIQLVINECTQCTATDKYIAAALAQNGPGFNKQNMDIDIGGIVRLEDRNGDISRDWDSWFVDGNRKNNQDQLYRFNLVIEELKIRRWIVPFLDTEVTNRLQDL